MNIKIAKFIRREGYCCLWAWFEANHRELTADLAKRLTGICTLRAVQQQREKFRAKSLSCEKCKDCLKEKVLDRKTAIYLRKET